MSEPRIIKRYANRKLYDTQHSCYVTLEQIAEMIREGEDVRIVDNNTKEDLTSVTFAQIIFEEEKKRRLLPLVGLKAIIQTSGESIQDFVKQVRGEVDQRMGRVFRRGGEGEEGEPLEDRPVADVAEPPKTTAAFREFLEGSQRRFDEWQAEVDQQIRKLVDSINPVPRLIKDLREVLARLEALEKRVSSLETRR